jgi:diadenosine tetraphosphate (Ap4A) HIT family hydrolase
MNCPFCNHVPASLWLESTNALALWDRFPIAEGHTLVVPRCHVASLFDMPPSELSAMWKFVAHVRVELATRLGVRSFNIGLNDGLTAGQTVNCHFPRYPLRGSEPHGSKPCRHHRRAPLGGQYIRSQKPECR